MVFPHFLRHFSVLLGCFFFTVVRAQLPDMTNFKRLHSNGPLPADFIIPTAEKYKSDLQKVDRNQQESMQKAEDEFYLMTNYQVDQMRFSGQVLVNDSLGQYVNAVADSLLISDPELRKKLHFYILRTPIVNAFATDQGAIFVTVGLLTRLSNEAELAFVLAHEIIHYKRRHVVTGYLETEKMRKGTDQYEGITLNNRFYKKHSYSRSQETQADEEGFELLLKSNYDPHAAVKGFDVLLWADYPFTDSSFTKDFFETPYFMLPTRVQPDTIKPFKPDEEDDDNDLATHPSVGKRRRGMMRLFKNASDTTGRYFLVSGNRFQRVKMMSRFEQCAMHNDEGDYQDAIYITYRLLQQYPGNFFLEKEMTRALYGSTLRKNLIFNSMNFYELFQNIFTTISTESNEEKPNGEIGRLKRVYRKSDAKGWTILSLNYAWKMHTKYPNDNDLKKWTTALMRELTVIHDLKKTDFEISDSLFVVIGNTAMADTILKIKGNKPETEREKYRLAIDNYKIDSLYTNLNYWSFAFIEQWKDINFSQMFSRAVSYADSLDQVKDLFEQMSSSQSRTYRQREIEMLTGGQELRKIVLVSPQFIAYDERNEAIPLDIQKTLDGRNQFLTELKSSSASCGIELVVLDQTSLDTNAVQTFNDMNTAVRWFELRDNSDEKKIFPFSQNEMLEVAKKYGTNYFMWTAYITSKNKRSGTFFRALSVVLLPIAPHTAYRLATPREDVYFMSIVYDVVENKVKYVSRTEMERQRNTPSRMRLHVYDLMRQLSKKKK
jgi:hypothetical protein